MQLKRQVVEVVDVERGGKVELVELFQEGAGMPRLYALA